MTIDYRDSNNKSIPEEEAIQLSYFEKHFFENQQLVGVEFYKKGTLQQLDHYRLNGETNEEIIRVYRESPGVFPSYINIIDKEMMGDYIIHSKQVYYSNTGFEEDIYKELRDASGNVICEAQFDRNGIQIHISSTEKYLFSSESVHLLSFEYKADGSINYVWGDLVNETTESWHGSIYLDDIERHLPNLLSENPYYANANFLPESSKEQVQ